MTKKPRIIMASVWAPLAVLLIPVILALVAIYSSSIPGDDALRRAGAIFMFLIPFAYLIVALLMAAAGYFLAAIGKLNLKNLLIGCGVLSLAAGAIFGLPSPFGARDRLIGFGIFGIGTMLCLSIGVFCWWFLAHLGQNKSASQEMPEDA
jgi:hypothetical protein